jgi:hypothetical protein
VAAAVNSLVFEAGMKRSLALSAKTGSPDRVATMTPMRTPAAGAISTGSRTGTGGGGAAQAASTTPRARTALRSIDTRFLSWRLR